MDLLIHLDCFVEYLNCLLKPDKTSFDSLLMGIFNNSANKIIISKELQESISVTLSANHPLRNFYEMFIAQMINNRAVIVKSSGDNINSILLSMDSSYNAIATANKSGTYLKISHNEYQELSVLNFAVIKSSKKPNFHWLACNLSSVTPNAVTLRYNDFNTKEEIDTLLIEIYKIGNNHTFVNIFDRYLNLNHTIFDWFVNKSRVEYLTQPAPRHTVAEYKRDLRAKFNRAEVYISRSRDDIHERRIMYSGLIIEFDDDFPNIRPDRTTWKLDITCCDEVYKIFLHKKANLFTKTR